MRLRLLSASLLVAGLATVVAWTVMAQGAEIGTLGDLRRHAPLGMEGARRAKDTPTLNDWAMVAPSQDFTIHLPLVQRTTSPCSVAPTLISPTNLSVLDTLVPALVYFRGTHPVSYTQVLIADNPGLDGAIRYGCYGGTQGPRELRLFDNLEPATMYYWRAQDVCGSTRSPHSPSFSFRTGSGGTILDPPALVSPADGAAGIGQEVTATWTSVPGAVGYQVRRNGVLYHPSATSIVLSSLQPNTTYDWHVRSYNDYAYSSASDQWQFTTGAFVSLGRGFVSLQPEAFVCVHLPNGDRLYVDEPSAEAALSSSD